MNERLAEILGVPFIGCASHKFNLAVRHFLTKYEPTIAELQGLSPLANSTKKADKFRQQK